MVDARSDVRLTQRLVDERRPMLPQVEVLLSMIGQLAPATLEGWKIETCFRTETRRCHLAGGGQQVGVEIARVSVGTGLVHREIHGHFVALRQVAGNRPCQGNTLAGSQLRRQADLILARDPRVVTLFGMLSGIPQFLAIAGPRDRHPVELSRQEYLGMQHVPAASVLAMAMRVHLGTLLQALLEAQLCTREEVRDFVRELERDALQYDED